jgi:hypothetical protein
LIPIPAYPGRIAKKAKLDGFAKSPDSRHGEERSDEAI